MSVVVSGGWDGEPAKRAQEALEEGTRGVLHCVSISLYVGYV
jgi:hypothetical protein